MTTHIYSYTYCNANTHDYRSILIQLLLSPICLSARYACICLYTYIYANVMHKYVYICKLVKFCIYVGFFTQIKYDCYKVISHSLSLAQKRRRSGRLIPTSTHLVLQLSSRQTETKVIIKVMKALAFIRAPLSNYPLKSHNFPKHKANIKTKSEDVQMSFFAFKNIQSVKII